jgi:hypothetical protein
MDADPMNRKDQIEVTGLNEGIGIALDLKGGITYIVLQK